MSPRRQFLILQGLPGSFFRDLAEALQARDHGVHRVNFNGGDLWAWRFSGLNYRGSQRDWPSYLARLIRERGVTDVVLFGDCRPMHRTARATAAGLGVAVHVFEEGYVRPDFVTLERGGVNAFSSLPADPNWYLREAEALQPVQSRPALPEAFPHRARAAIAYYCAALLMTWAFPRARTHRPWHPLAEAAGWAGRLAQRGRAARRSAAAARRLAGTPYFLLPLQLDSDYQLRAHSDFDGMQPALAHTVASFARSAPPDVKLVVKEHPLDNGLQDWRRRTIDYARALGVEDRIVFLEVGDIDVLVRAACGVVTVNSTTGTLALAAGVPVTTLGRAIYDLPGLTHQGGLDDFWRTPAPPDGALYEAFRRVLAHNCLLYGGFYDLGARADLLDAAVERMLAAPVTAAPWTASDAVASPSPPTRAAGRRARAAAARAPSPAFADLGRVQNAPSSARAMGPQA